MASAISESSTWAYLVVVLIDACPSAFCTSRRLPVSRRSLVAKSCLRSWKRRPMTPECLRSRPQNVCDLGCNRHRHSPATLAEFHDLLALDLAPLQEALVEPQPRSTGKGKERGIVRTHHGVELVGFVVGQFSHPFHRHFEQMASPFRLMLKTDTPQFCSRE